METLTRFNQEILQCQDDAYTLAWYLLGDEEAAEAVLQKAVEASYHCFSSRNGDCRFLILKQVVDQCRTRDPIPGSLDEPGIGFGLRLLGEHERVVLVLADILGLGYREVARVTNQSYKDVGRLLCTARRKLEMEREP